MNTLRLIKTYRCNNATGFVYEFRGVRGASLAKSWRHLVVSLMNKYDRELVRLVRAHLNGASGRTLRKFSDVSYMMKLIGKSALGCTRSMAYGVGKVRVELIEDARHVRLTELKFDATTAAAAAANDDRLMVHTCGEDEYAVVKVSTGAPVMHVSKHRYTRVTGDMTLYREAVRTARKAS